MPAKCKCGEYNPMTDARSAAQFHIETFGAEAFDDDRDVDAAYVAKGTIGAV